MVTVTNYWYVSSDQQQPLGPIKERDLIQKLKQGILNWSHFACNPAMDLTWTRLSDIDFLKPYLPEKPTQVLYREIEKDFQNGTRNAGPLPRTGAWLLQFNGSHFGPMTPQEAQIFVTKMKVTTTLYAWRPGLSGWVPAEQVPEIKVLVDQIKNRVKKSSGTHEQRTSTRAALLATVTLTPEGTDEAVVGVCRDISKGGIFVVTPETMLVGAVVEIRVEPVSDCGINEFTALGTVVSQPSREGIAVKFTRLNPETAKELVDYTESVG